MSLNFILLFFFNSLLFIHNKQTLCITSLITCFRTSKKQSKCNKSDKHLFKKASLRNEAVNRQNSSAGLHLQKKKKNMDIKRLTLLVIFASLCTSATCQTGTRRAISKLYISCHISDWYLSCHISNWYPSCHLSPLMLDRSNEKKSNKK